MIVVADESVEKSIVDRLRDDGWVVDFVPEFASGTADDDLLRRAAAVGALLLTSD